MKAFSKLNKIYKDMIVEEVKKSKLTRKAICTKYDISSVTYDLIKKEYKLPRKIAKRIRRNFIDDNYFSVIDSEEKAYWLGFLYADGCIFKQGEYYTIVLALSSTDKEHLSKFKKSINTSYKIREYSKNGIYPYCRMECCSKQMFYDLINLGCIEKKTLLLDFPIELQVPKHLINHFMRGYFDGDGTINSHKEVGNKRNQVRLQVLGTEDFLKGYINELPLSSKVKENITLQKTKNIRTIQICGNIQSKRVFDFLYKNATIYLDRKHEKYIEYFNK